MSPSRSVLASLAAVPLLLLATGCSGGVEVGGPRTVSASDVEKEVTSVITDQGRTGATVTVTSVDEDGDGVQYDVSTVPYLTSTEAGQQAGEVLAAQIGTGTPPDIACPDELVGNAGTTMVCTLSDAGQTYDTTMTVTEDADGMTGFDVQVADTPR